MLTTDRNIPHGERIAYDLKGAARAASVSERTLHLAMRSGALPARKLGRKIMIMHEDIHAWLLSLPMDERVPSGATIISHEASHAVRR